LVRGRPALRGGSVYAATERAHLHCLDVRTGSERWAVRTGEPAQHQFAAVVDDSVILLDGKWHVTAFDAATGRLRWLARLRSAGCWCPVAHGRYLVTLSELGHVAVLDPECEVKVWEGSVPGSYHQQPAVGERTLVIASNSVGLAAYDINPAYQEAVLQ